MLGQEKLYKKYPELFKQVTWDKMKTCMCWGITTGTGWYKLMDKTCEALMKKAKELDIPIPSFGQVKEKFGSLTIYIECDDKESRKHWEAFQSITSQAGQKSMSICEDCGAPGELRKGSWLRTNCNKCYAKRQARLEEYI